MYAQARNGSLGSRTRWQWLALAVLSFAWAHPARAVPEFARQTGQACNACHVGGFGPQLTAFGRAFKLGGYTLSTTSGFNAPLSAMLVESYTHTSKDLSGPAGPHDGSNDNWSLQQLSLFAAGRISEHIGMLGQVTYSDIDRKVAMDNVDVRYARNFSRGGHGGVFGITVNNNPTVSDVWNTLPAWKFPYMASELAPGPTASPLIYGGLGQQVIGAGAYVSLDDRYYGEVGAYRTLSRSVLDTFNVDYGGRLAGAAPYWRLTWNHDWNGQTLMFGLVGLTARLQPDGAGTPSDRFRDIGVDGAFERYFEGGNALTVNASYVHEKQTLDASFADAAAERTSHTINAASLDASYYFHDTYGATVGWFNTTGTRDAILFSADPDDGSVTGNPASRGEIVQVDWTPFGKRDSWAEPWANLRIGVQYTIYDKFNGASHNYDGFGRNASDNDTLFVFLWTAI